MDKAKKPNRFFSPVKRQLKQSGSNDGGDVNVTERSKREKVKGLSSIGRANLSKENSEIRGGSEGEEELPLSTGGGKRFKVHSKPLNDCNAIDHAAVPRKLRSAMIKRNRESLSPPLPGAKKLRHTPYGTQQPQINGAKKFKQKMKQGGLGQAESIPITKDEEEVVETLYALARMFPNNKPVKSQVDQKVSEAKSPPLRETLDSPVLASEAPKEASTKSHKASISVEATNLPSSVEGSGCDAEKVNCLTESSALDRPTIFGNQKFVLGLSSISSPDPRISLLSKSEHTDDTPMSVAATSGLSIELCHGTRSTQATRNQASCEQKPELWTVAAIATKQEEQSIKENKDSDTRLACIEGTSALSLREGTNTSSSVPGLSMVGSHDSELPRSSSSKVPAWLDSATSSTKPISIGNDVSNEKVNPVMIDRKQSLKKCATHVYISRLIQLHQASEKKPRWPVPPDQIKPNGEKLGATAANSQNGLRNGLHGLISVDDKNGLNGVITIGGSNGSDAGKNMNEVRSGIVKDKQSCDFLSLSTCGGGLRSAAPTNDINHGGNKSESSAQCSVPYLHPIVQHLSLMPFSLHGRSSPYPDQLTVAASQQLKSPQHMGSPFYGPQHLIHADPAKQQQQQQQQHQQQQQQMWAAHYMPGRNPTSNFPKWQNGKHDSPILISCGGQPLQPSSSLRQEVLSSKFPHTVQQQQQQQQQQLYFVSPSSSSRGKMHHHHQHHHLPSGYDGGGGFHADGSSHLKLVCNADHLDMDRDRDDTPALELKLLL
ncbi:hypothetical protein BVC80_1831g109 [Macleaya cordata]|uniref:Uncharacterized protein n=1 Tax=Macleaya cordata TaxID=56857 RepID=A0A200R772_MACCD|nr:hypothetical protein BVC80_1831g109 [Macleaya cordata]